MNTKTLTAVAVILASLPAMSWAQEGSTMRHQPPQIDFATADADASGGISAEEWSAYITAQMTERRAAMIGERVDALIAAGDANGDAALDRDELLAGFMQMGEERGDRGDRGERGHGRGHERGHGHGDRDHDRGDQNRGDRDRGGDGDRQGMERGERGDQMAGRMFDRMDQNDDGQIDADELSEMQERMQRRMERRGDRMGDRDDN